MQQTLTQTLWMRKVRSMPCCVWCQAARLSSACTLAACVADHTSCLGPGALVLTLAPAVVWLPACLPAGLPLVYNEARIAAFWGKRPGELASRWTRFAAVSGEQQQPSRGTCAVVNS